MSRSDDDSVPRVPLEMSVSAQHVPWRLAKPDANESCRWSCVDGRWVSLTIVRNASPVTIVVADSNGHSETVGSHTAALELARKMRGS
jgi:hypothetical protein